MNTSGERLKFLRNKKKLTQKELSEATGIKQATISRYEKDEFKPASDALIILSKYFNVPSEWILNGNGFSELEEEYKSTQVHKEKFKELEGLKYLDGSKVDSRDKHKIIDIVDGAIGDLMFNQTDVYSEFNDEDMEKIKQSIVNAVLTIKDAKRKERLDKAKRERDRLNEEIKNLELEEGTDKDEK